MARISNSKWFRPDDPLAVLPPPPGRSFVAEPSAMPPVSDSLLVKRNAGKSKRDKEGRCRMCLRPDAIRALDEHVLVEEDEARPLTRHHLIPQQWFKRYRPPLRDLRNCDACIVPLCAPCHQMVERDVEARRMLRRVLMQDEIVFCIQVRGKAWFDRRYPQ